MTNKIFFSVFLLLIFFIKICYSQEIIFKGLNKLNLNDLKTITDIDFNNKTLPSSDVNLLIKDLYNSDLIYDLSVINMNNKIIITIDESKIIKGEFSLKNLSYFIKCTTLCPQIEMYLENDKPLVVKYYVASLGEVKLCLAPLPKETKL